MSTSKTNRLARIAAGAAVIAAVAALTQPALAGDARREKVPSSYPTLQKMKAADVMHMIDAEKKGYVTREEFMKFHEALFDKIDANGDQRVSMVEFTDQG